MFDFFESQGILFFMAIFVRKSEKFVINVYEYCDNIIYISRVNFKEERHMKISRKIIVLLIVCLIITVEASTDFFQTTLTVEAHSGRTDSSGGHKDIQNKSGLGSYHYHHGYPAHLHTNGVCPYADLTTTTNSNASSSGANNSINDKTTVTTQSSGNITTTTKQSITISDTSYDNVAFNASYYASKHEDVYKTLGDNAKALYDHFITSGIYEGRQSSAQFNIFVYKNNNQDLVDAFGDDLIKYYNHFIEYGVNEDRVSK